MHCLLRIKQKKSWDAALKKILHSLQDEISSTWPTTCYWKMCCLPVFEFLQSMTLHFVWECAMKSHTQPSSENCHQ
jgi:hypothetical protein